MVNPPNMVREINTENFNSEVLSDNGVVVVDFFATWCGPCKMQAPILYEFKKEIGQKVIVAKVDVDQNADIANQYSIASIPTLAVFKNGQMQEKTVGLSTKANLSEMLIKHI